VIGPFEETPAIDVGGTPLRAITPLGKSHLTSFALEAGEHALRFFSEYFDIPYPGDKLDLVAIPDFAFGAMENLGCVTFRESAMLVDPAKASLQELERVATVVAHEIAHMWFGDLVTMQWWEGIWLNEAFATFMEVLCTNNFRPEWKPWLSFATDRDMALEIDGLHATRPIEYEVVSPSEMRGMFDLLTYEKGGSVLRMLEQFLGPDVFRDGIRHYLKKHSYANTVTTDLWDALEEISGQPVRDTMNTWILQGGHPLVELENGILSQRPFAYGEPGPVPSAIGSNWLTPVVTRPLPTGDVEKILLGKDPVTVGTGARVINGGGVGVFRSRYGSVELGMVASHLDQLDEIERAVLFADSWAALFSSRTTWSDFLGLARRLGDKDEPTSWRFIAQAFDFAQRAADDRQRRDLAHPVREIFGPQLARLGYDVREGESPLAGQVRATAIGILGTLGADEVVQERCADLTSRGEFDGDMARAALRVTAGLNRREDFDLFLQRARDAESPQIQQRYQWGLADFTEEPFALEAAEHCFNEFRTQDAPIVLGLLSRQRATGPAVWKLVTSRWNEIRDRFPPNVQSRVTSGVPTFIADHPFAAEVAEFHRSHPIPGEERLLEQLLERLRVGLDFADAMRTQL
jgi:puromycin-sensitive aminopeptidase